MLAFILLLSVTSYQMQRFIKLFLPHRLAILYFRASAWFFLPKILFIGCFIFRPSLRYRPIDSGESGFFYILHRQIRSSDDETSFFAAPFTRDFTPTSPAQSSIKAVIFSPTPFILHGRVSIQIFRIMNGFDL